MPPTQNSSKHGEWSAWERERDREKSISSHFIIIKYDVTQFAKFAPKTVSVCYFTHFTVLISTAKIKEQTSELANIEI